ncbi:MAG: dockerin type I domain-containing protein [Planctomycetota bacterium]|jgi:hypothetical protein
MKMCNFTKVIVALIVLASPTLASAKMFFIYESIDATAVNVDEMYLGSTGGAIGTNESSCGYNDTIDVWHSFTATSTEPYKISLCGSTFDTTLSVFDPNGTIDLACNDDYCDLQSELTIGLTAGENYLIRVAGYDGETGDYTLTIETTPADLNVGLTIDNLWMYQNLPGRTGSNLTASISIIDDPVSNSSYSCEWELILPSDVNAAPTTMAGGEANSALWTFAARGCDEPAALSDSGQTFTVRVIVIGNDYGNMGTAEVEFGIALLGDANNDTLVNLKDRQMVNDYWQVGPATSLTLKDCDMNRDDVVNLKDRSITNDIWRGEVGQNSVSSPCPFR